MNKNYLMALLGMGIAFANFDQFESKLGFSTHTPEQVKIKESDNGMQQIQELAVKYPVNQNWWLLKDAIPELVSQDKDKPLVIGYFAYNASSFLKIEKVFEQFPDAIRSPLSIQEKGKALLGDAELFFTLQKLLPAKRFNEINEDLMERLSKGEFTVKDERFYEWLQQYGVAKELFDKYFEQNVEINNRALQSYHNTESMPIRSIPMVIVQGKYVILSNTIEKMTVEQLKELISYLVLLAGKENV